MPLSEHEQRILAELEESLARHDPRFAQRVRSKSEHPYAGRHCKWSVVTFVIGLGVLVGFYSQSIVLGLFGVAVMFMSAVFFERNLRRLGRTGWTDQSRARQDADEDAGDHAVHGTRDWLRSRFRRDH